MKAKDQEQVQLFERALRAVYNRARAEDIIAGMAWYEHGHAICASLARAYGVTLAQSCAVMSVLSPRQRWYVNVIDASNTLRAWSLHHARAHTNQFRRQVDKAIDILDNGAGLGLGALMPLISASKTSGHKTRAFARNLYNPHDNQAVTIDTHMATMLGITNITPRLYKLASIAIRNCAARQDLLPCQYQAITWLVWRHEHRSEAFLRDNHWPIAPPWLSRKG